MKKYLVGAILALAIAIPIAANAQDSTQTLLNVWRRVSGYIVPTVTTNGLRVPALGSSGNPCLSVGATGIFATTTCGSGGGGATTTINSFTGPSFTFATSNHASLLQTITGSGSTLTWNLQPATGYSIPLTASTSEWSTAYGWGDHSAEGYLTVETDPIWTAASSTYLSTTTAASTYQPIGAYLTGVAWGDITGSLSGQTDLQLALDAKLSTTSAASTYEPILTKGDLTANSPLSFDNTRQVIGGAAAISLDTSGTWTGNAGTATALAANAANCSAGSAAGGVSAAGAAEDCTDYWTEAENTTADYLQAADLSNYILHSYASSTFVSYGYGSSTFPTLSYASSTFPTFNYASSTFQPLGSYITNTYASSAFVSLAYGSSTYVSSVALSVPTGLTVAGSPVETTGTLAVSLDTGYVIPLQSTLDTFSTYAYGSSTYLSLAYASSTFPSFAYASNTFQTLLTLPLSIANGGTATTSSPTLEGQLLGAHGSGSWGVVNLLQGAGVTITTSTLGQITLSTTLGTSVDLASAEITGTLAVANGGTGRTALLHGYLVYGATTSTDSFVGLATGTLGTVLQMKNNIPTWVATSTLGITGGTGCTAVGDAGSIQYSDGAGGCDSDARLYVSTDTDFVDVNIEASTSRLSLLNPNTFDAMAQLYSNADDNEAGLSLTLSEDTAIALNTSADSYFLHDGNLGVGTSTPTTTLFVQGKAGTNPFAIASSTGTQLFTVTQAGNVGIGTTTPGRTLTVVGSIRGTGILYDSSNASGSAGNFLMSTATGYQWTATSTLFGTLLSGSNTGDVTLAGENYLSLAGQQITAADIALTSNVTGILPVANGGTGAPALTANLILFGNGTNPVATSTSFIWDNSNTRLGVGSGTPIATLSVKGAGAGTVNPFIVSSSTDSVLLQVAANGSTTLSSLGTGPVFASSGSLFIGTLDISSHTNLAAGRSLTLSGDSVEADAELFTHKKTITITAASGTISATTTAAQFELPQASTVTEVSCSTDTGSATIQLDERARATPNTAGTDVMSSTLACDNNAETTSSFANAGIAADVPVNLDIDSVASSPTRVRIHIKFTYDD